MWFVNLSSTNSERSTGHTKTSKKESKSIKIKEENECGMGSGDLNSFGSQEKLADLTLLMSTHRAVM